MISCSAQHMPLYSAGCLQLVATPVTVRQSQAQALPTRTRSSCWGGVRVVVPLLNTGANSAAGSGVKHQRGQLQICLPVQQLHAQVVGTGTLSELTSFQLQHKQPVHACTCGWYPV